MPELPEVETVCRGLAREIQSQKIVAVRTNRAGLRKPFPAALKTLTGVKIKSIARRAKYILIHLQDARTLIVHLGMSGRMTVTKKYTPEKHDHVVLTLGNKTVVALNDARRFGIVDLCATDMLTEHALFAHLGPEPLEKAFSAKYLIEKLRDRKTAIKIAIMDQRVVVGVGNIYASEALFMAGIDPRRESASLTPDEIKKLIAAIRKVLKAAIRAGGSSLKDYVQTDGALGYFQHSFSVYDRAGESCTGCNCAPRKTGGVQKCVQGGRTTFYCVEKQS